MGGTEKVMMESKKMFTPIDINIFIPKRENKITSTASLMDVIEEDFGSLERYQYYVSNHPLPLL